MEIIKVKVKDKKTGTIYEVKKTLANDYIGTGDFELVTEKEEKKVKEEKKSTFFKPNEK